MIRKRFQNKITAGKFTFPVVITIFALLWGLIYFVKPEIEPTKEGYYYTQLINNLSLNEFLERIINFILYGVIIYILIGINNTYSLIRTRTTFQACIYSLFIAACPVLQPLQQGALVTIAVCISLYFLFRTYQKNEPTGNIFHSYLFLGLGSLLFPQLIYLFPVWIIGEYNLQSLTPRTFFAGLVGISFPYWFLLGHAFFYNEMELFYAPFKELISFNPVNFNTIPLWELVTVGVVFLITLISIIHYLFNNYQDKIRTRSYLNFLVLLGVILLASLLLQPQHTKTVLPLLLICTSILMGHFFALTSSKASNVIFIISIILLIALLYCNLWMPYHNF